MIGDVFDIETDGLSPTKIHCLSVSVDGDKKKKSTSNYANIRKYMGKAKILVGHNIIRYDIPAIERLLGIKVEARLVDTLALSWYLYPDRLMHGLEQWGEELGVAKPKIDDWENLDAKDYIHRCETDVEINRLLWKKMWDKLLKLYGSEEEALRLIDYLSFKLKCAQLQEQHRWKLDVDRCKDVLERLTAEKEQKVEELKASMPLVPKMAKKHKPKKMYLKGQLKKLTVAGESWFALLKEQNLPEDYDGVVEYVKEWEEPKPTSVTQLKSWLNSLGWEPETFKYERNKVTGDVRKIPQIQQDKSKGPGLCASVKKLFDKEPGLEPLEGLTILTHRISVLNGFLENVDEEGYVRAEVQGLTNTLRFKHRVVVNLPGIDKPYGGDIRGCLVAPEGYELCGSDMSSLEDRTKQHYMWKHDPDYVREMMTPDFDPHLNLAEFAKALTPEKVLAYKSDELQADELKLVKSIRHVYKQVNYACVYGAGGATVARSAGVPLHKGEELVETYWKRNWSVKAIAEEQIVKVVGGQKWLFNPVSKFWYSLRYEKDRFSTLNQGTGVYCFDRWLSHVMDGGPPIIGQMHDEWIALIRKGNRDKMKAHVAKAIKLVNKELQLNRELECSVEFGDNYADIH